VPPAVSGCTHIFIFIFIFISMSISISTFVLFYFYVSSLFCTCFIKCRAASQMIQSLVHAAGACRSVKAEVLKCAGRQTRGCQLPCSAMQSTLAPKHNARGNRTCPFACIMCPYGCIRAQQVVLERPTMCMDAPVEPSEPLSKNKGKCHVQRSKLPVGLWKLCMFSSSKHQLQGC